MEASHLMRLLASVILLLAVCYVSANPTTPVSTNPILQDTCPVVVQVGYGYSLAHINLQESQDFQLNPNMPLMRMMIQEDDVLYKVTVSGTTVNVLRCEVQGANCDILNQGGSKSSNILMADRWNIIHVNYSNGEIAVDANNRSLLNVAGGSTKTKGWMNADAQLTFLVPSARPNYEAKVMIPCYDKPPIIRTELPLLTTSTAATTTQSLQRPYEKCPAYKVETDHPSHPAVLLDNLTMAIQPSHPSLQLIITGNKPSYAKYNMKVTVYDFMMELQECEVPGQGCSTKSNIPISESVLVPRKWNNVTLSLHGDVLFIEINKWKKQLWTSVQSRYGNILNVVVMAPQDKDSKVGEYYVAFVNVMCDNIEQVQMFPTMGTPEPTKGGLPTKVPIVEIPTETPTTGMSQDVVIVVGVLVGLLVLIGLAILISTIKKRRSAAISENSPLQDQFQQQE